MPRKVINNKNEISRNCLNGMQEVGLAHSTDEASKVACTV